MSSLKPVVFMAVFGAFCGMAAGVNAAGPLLPEDLPAVKGAAAVQLVDGDAGMSGRGILNGYKGYRHHRPGYRRHKDGWWYPLKAFDKKPENAAEPAEHRKAQIALPAEHVRWCKQTYFSYREEDNTFQPYEGPRKPCRSAFLKKK